MSREIKFRFLKIWGDRNNFHYSDQYCSKDGYTMCGQYTGLKDRNGKEIYEGDIIKTPGWCNITVRIPNIYQQSYGYDRSGTVIFDFNDKCEIIGNIYEQNQD